jgi:hypothetical protein
VARLRDRTKVGRAAPRSADRDVLAQDESEIVTAVRPAAHPLKASAQQEGLRARREAMDSNWVLAPPVLRAQLDAWQRQVSQMPTLRTPRVARQSAHRVKVLERPAEPLVQLGLLVARVALPRPQALAELALEAPQQGAQAVSGQPPVAERLQPVLLRPAPP